MSCRNLECAEHISQGPNTHLDSALRRVSPNTSRPEALRRLPKRLRLGREWRQRECTCGTVEVGARLGGYRTPATDRRGSQWTRGAGGGPGASGLAQLRSGCRHASESRVSACGRAYPDPQAGQRVYGNGCGSALRSSLGDSVRYQYRAGGFLHIPGMCSGRGLPQSFVDFGGIARRRRREGRKGQSVMADRLELRLMATNSPPNSILVSMEQMRTGPSSNPAVHLLLGCAAWSKPHPKLETNPRLQAWPSSMSIVGNLESLYEYSRAAVVLERISNNPVSPAYSKALVSGTRDPTICSPDRITLAGT
ncbi:hypothetical protein C8R44DRAFT_724549 [Mycena epipterygia]|nr:hypothetical protein C8R44DRAFT_724549 [Mycena epipterygia]